MEGMSVEEESDLEVENATTRIRERGTRICQAEQTRALDRLRARRDLSEREEDVVRNLARRLTEALLSVPESHLDAVQSGDADPQAAAVALELFGEK